MKRKQAADLIDGIRVLVAQWEKDERDGEQTVCQIALLFAKRGINNLDPCDGEAHSNAYIDNCSLCYPRWGWVGAKEPVT